MLTILVAGLILLGAAITLIRLVSFVITEVVPVIRNWLIERNCKKEMLLPHDTYNEVIDAVRQKNPQLAVTLKNAMNDDGDDDCKMGFAFDYEGNIKEASKVTAENSADDDLNRVTNIYDTGKYKMYA